MRDPYEVLGVKKTADAAAIKSAYRKLAKKLHPDANKNDPKAAQRFAEINSAYEILGEDDKRKAFDRGEIDAEGKPRFSGFEGFGPGGMGAAGRSRRGRGPDVNFEEFSFGPEGMRRTGGGARGGGQGGFSNLEDVLQGMFGSGGFPRGGGAGFAPEGMTESGGHDLTAEVTVTLAEAAKGATRRVHLPTGKEVDVKNSGRARRGQTDPPQRAGPARSGRYR